MRSLRRRPSRVALAAVVLTFAAACDDDATTTGTGGSTSSSATGSTTSSSTSTTTSSMDLCANVDCPPPGACQTAITCNPATGLCDASLKDNGVPCDDGVACTTNDVCGGGVCTGLPVVCPANASCVAGQCVAAACTGNLGLPGPPRFDGGDVGVVLDLDGDAVVDALTLDGGAAVVWSGEGGGFFHPTSSFPIAGTPTTARVADLDGNGNPDVVLGNASAGTIHVVYDDGSVLDVGGFASPPTVVVPADVAGSPLPDVVTFAAAGDFGVVVNNGGMAFSPTSVGNVGATPRDAVASDFNGDGKTDVAVATSDGLRVLIGNGAGGFSPPTVYGANASFTSVDAVDLDGDGKRDLAAASAAGAVIVENTGAAFVVVNTISGMHVDGVRAADMDGDGALDLVFRGTCTDVGCGPGLNDNVSVLLNAGGFGFTPLGMTERAAGPGGVVVADVDGDMNRDVVVSGAGTVTPLLQDPTGMGILPGAPALAIPGTAAIATGDFDGDGTVDVVLSRHPIGPGAYNTVDLYKNNGVGVVPGAVSLGTDSSEPAPTGIAAADVDHDGHLDVVLLGPGPAVHWMRNTNASGAFGDLKTVTLPAAARTFDVSDLDDDGDVDVAITVAGVNGVVVVDDLGGAADTTTIPMPSVPSALSSADVDGDGDRDLVVVLSGVGGGVQGAAFYRNDGASWTPLPVPTALAPTAVVARDVDADGHVDVVVTDATHFELYFGDGAGGFEPSSGVPANGVGATTANGVVVLDVDTDGLPDVVAVSALRNDATLFRHTAPRAFTVDRYGVSSKPFAAVTLDLDLDARPDVVVVAETFIDPLLARCAP